MGSATHQPSPLISLRSSSSNSWSSTTVSSFNSLSVISSHALHAWCRKLVPWQWVQYFSLSLFVSKHCMYGFNDLSHTMWMRDIRDLELTLQHVLFFSLFMIWLSWSILSLGFLLDVLDDDNLLILIKMVSCSVSVCREGLIYYLRSFEMRGSLVSCALTLQVLITRPYLRECHSDLVWSEPSPLECQPWKIPCRNPKDVNILFFPVHFALQMIIWASALNWKEHITVLWRSDPPQRASHWKESVERCEIYETGWAKGGWRGSHTSAATSEQCVSLSS